MNPVICPNCGASSDETVDRRFSGPESAIRVHDDEGFYDCKRCGHHWDKDGV